MMDEMSSHKTARPSEILPIGIIQNMSFIRPPCVSMYQKPHKPPMKRTTPRTKEITFRILSPDGSY